MTFNAVLLIGLLSIGVQSVLGQAPDSPAAKLVKIQNSMKEICAVCLRISTAPVDPSNDDLDRINSKITDAENNISGLPSQSGNIFDTTDHDIFRATHVAITDASNHIVYAVNSLIKKNTQTLFSHVQLLLFSLQLMIDKVVGALESKFNTWTPLLPLLNPTPPVLFDARRSLLLSLDALVPRLCKLRASDFTGPVWESTKGQFETALREISSKARGVNLLSCRGSGCLDGLIPIANRMSQKTNCAFYYS